MDNNISKGVFINTIYNYIGSISIFILSFITLKYLTGSLNIEQFGQYNLVLSTQIFFVLLLNLGLPSLILRFVPECIVRNDFITARKIIFRSTVIIFLCGIVVTIVTSILYQHFPSIIEKLSLAKYIIIASLLGLSGAEVRIFEAAFCAFLRQAYKIFFEVLSAIVKILLFVLSIKLGLGLLGIIFSIGIVDILLIITYFIRMNYYLHAKTTGSTNIQKHRFLNFGIKEYLSKLLSFFWDARIDAYFITFYLGAPSTGIFYFVISIVSMLVNYMPGSIMQPISQMIFSRQYAKYENQKEISYLFNLNNKFIAFFIFPVFIGFLLLSGRIVNLFFAKYADAVRLFPVILFFMLFYIFLIPIRNIITTLEKSEITVLSSLVFFYKIPMTMFLTKNFGLMGTAFAVGTSFILYFIIQLILTKRIIKIGYPWVAFLKILINSLIATIMIVALKPLIRNVFSLCAIILISSLVYSIASFLNKAFNDYDRQVINKSFNRPVWIF